LGGRLGGEGAGAEKAWAPAGTSPRVPYSEGPAPPATPPPGPGEGTAPQPVAPPVPVGWDGPTGAAVEGGGGGGAEGGGAEGGGAEGAGDLPREKGAGLGRVDGPVAPDGPGVDR
jgi:hypothetical protein